MSGYTVLCKSGITVVENQVDLPASNEIIPDSEIQNIIYRVLLLILVD